MQIVEYIKSILKYHMLPLILRNISGIEKCADLIFIFYHYFLWIYEKTF